MKRRHEIFVAGDTVSNGDEGFLSMIGGAVEVAAGGAGASSG